MTGERLLTEDEEDSLADIIRSARHIQKFLWGKVNEEIGLEEWRRMFRKRMAKLEAIDVSNPYAIIELKKRVLQLGALSVGLLGALGRKGILPEFQPNEPPSNLPQYAETCTAKDAECHATVERIFREIESISGVSRGNPHLRSMAEYEWQALKQKEGVE